MMLEKHKLLKLVAYCFIGLAILTSLSILLLRSESFSRLIVSQFIDSTTDGTLGFEMFEGNFLTGLKLSSIDYKDNQNHISIGKMQVDLGILSLLEGKLRLRNITMQGVEFSTKSSADTIFRDAFFLLKNNIPQFRVIVENARLDGLVFHAEGNQQYGIERVLLKLFIDDDKLHITHCELEEKNIFVNLTSNVVLNSPYLFHSEVRWRAMQSEKVNFKGKLEIDGDINLMTIKHQLYEPLHVKLDGDIKLNPLNTDQMHLEFEGDLSGQNLPSMSFEASGKGSLQDFELEKFITNSLGGVVNADGYISWKSSLQWYLIIKGMDINPGKHWALWPGKLDFNAKARGESKTGGPVLQLDEISVVGDLLNQPFRMSGGLLINSKETITEKLSVNSGKNRLLLNGTVSLNSNLQFDFDVPEPEKLWTGIYGHFRGEGHVSGDMQYPVGTVTLDGTDVRYGDYKLQKIDGLVGIDLKDTSQSKAHFQVQELRVADIYFSESTLDLGGDFQGFRANVNIISPSTNLTLGFNGSCFKDSCEFMIDNASFDLQPYGRYQLFSPVQLVIDPGAVKPFDSCWTQEDSAICLKSSWSRSSGWRSEGDADAPVLMSALDIIGDFFNKEHLGWNKKTSH